VECVPNVSEGRRPEVIEALTAAVQAAPGCCLLDVHSDVDHNRSVFTFAGSPGAVKTGALALAARAIELLDMRVQDGVHPRLGAIDVVPFVPLAGIEMVACVDLARETAEALAETHLLPVYLYAEAAWLGRPAHLSEIRRSGLGGRGGAATTVLEPDFGPPVLHPTAGATTVGARAPLVAFNLLLETADVAVARRVAGALRESGGGLSGVQAIGLYLPSRGRAQVSVNLLDHRLTSLDMLVTGVRRLVSAEAAEVVEVELVGLAPEAALRDLSVEGLPGLPGPERSIEARLQACGG
jgi:glutamate formiminotransferase